jgi:energy-coupling factor transport system ATP-binding protein
MIAFRRVTFTYPGAPRPALREVNLRLPPGSFTLLVGPSGGGKSTLLRCLNGLVPHFSGGRLRGRVTVAGRHPVDATPGIMSRHVGFVFQDPEAQFVVDRVEDEVAFALENAGMPRAEMRERVGDALRLLGLTGLRERRVEGLSGGEKQRVALAAALALRPEVLALDEPTSQLDPAAAAELLQALIHLNAEVGLTVVLAEHRLERILPFVDHIVHLAEGEASSGPVAEMLGRLDALPPVTHLGRALGWSPLPRSVEEARPRAGELALPPAEPLPSPPACDSPLLVAEGVSVSYGRETILREVDLRLCAGETVALMGANGAGKTTLLRALVGLTQPAAGRVRVAGQDVADADVAEVCRRVGYLPQDPNALLFAETVLEELRVTLRNHEISVPEAPVPPEALLAELGLGEVAGAYPRDLSVGQRQRVALAAILITRPRVLLLDEPTRGLDYGAKARLLELLRGWKAAGMGVLLVTHDVELAAAAADRVLVLDGGRVVARGVPREVLDAPSPFAPQMARLFPGRGRLSVQEVVAGLEVGRNF